MNVLKFILSYNSSRLHPIHSTRQEVLHDYRQAIRKVIIEHVLKEEKAMEHSLAGWRADWGCNLQLAWLEASKFEMLMGWTSVECLGNNLTCCGYCQLSGYWNHRVGAVHSNNDTIRHLEVFIVFPLARPRNARESFSYRAPCHFGELKPFWDPWPTAKDQENMFQLFGRVQVPFQYLSMLKLDTISTCIDF